MQQRAQACRQAVERMCSTTLHWSAAWCRLSLWQVRAFRRAAGVNRLRSARVQLNLKRSKS